MFFITAIKSDSRPGFKVDRRTFGYTLDLLTAIDYIQHNTGSMQECLYDYLVIERIGPGIHADAVQVAWYKWEHSNWVVCERPFEFAHIVNWAIG